MREILFRAKAINRDKGYYRTNYKNGDWVYGLVTNLYDERWENLPAQMANTDGINGIEVDYTTISQYTGLTDKNGKYIFEGDILKCSDGKICTVKWDGANARFLGFSVGAVSNICYVGREPKSEVIGNIHDTPELLKEVQ